MSSRLRAALRHAFAVDPPGPAEPTPQQRAVVERVCRWIAARRLETPATLLLEMSRPLNALASAGLTALNPAAWALGGEATAEDCRHLAEYLERRGAIEWMERRIEQLGARG